MILRPQLWRIMKSFSVVSCLLTETRNWFYVKRNYSQISSYKLLKDTKTAFDEIILLPYYLNTYIEREEQFLLKILHFKSTYFILPSITSDTVSAGLSIMIFMKININENSQIEQAIFFNFWKKTEFMVSFSRHFLKTFFLTL